MSEAWQALGVGPQRKSRKLKSTHSQVRVGTLRADASGSLSRDRTDHRLVLNVEGPVSDFTALAAPVHAGFAD